jgi:hypothetical protein
VLKRQLLAEPAEVVLGAGRHAPNLVARRGFADEEVRRK